MGAAQIAHGPIFRNERGSTKYAPSPVLSPSLSLSAIHPARFSLAARTVVEPRGVPAANGNRVEAADEVDKFVRAFPVQDDVAIEFYPLRIIAWGLKTDLPNYARLVRNLNLELATLFLQLCRNLCHLCSFHCLLSSTHSCTATRNLTNSVLAV
ncbi:hypothetical protein D8M36_00560 [Dermabacter sp. HSID17554]|nr:hypothetical protein D8M36_00560 [Dermabacter sp. HSID17554]